MRGAADQHFVKQVVDGVANEEESCSHEGSSAFPVPSPSSLKTPVEHDGYAHIIPD